MTALPTSQPLARFPTTPGTDSSWKNRSPSNSAEPGFVDRRSGGGQAASTERRQFGNSYAQLTPEARALAEAIDRYKVDHCRRYITFEEMLQIITQLGYQRQV